MVLSIAGFHIPVIPFSEVVGRSGIVEPEQYVSIAVKVGVMPEVTTMVRVVEVAH